MVTVYLLGCVLMLFAALIDGERARIPYVVLCWPVALLVGAAQVVRENVK
jgi:hypothetical protein